MPELPEVETTRRGIAPHISGKRLVQLQVRDHRLRWPVPADLPGLIEGEVLRQVQRRAKYLLLQFDRGTVLVHLGMSGNLRVVSATEPAAKHDHVDWRFDDGTVLRLNDPRRFGAVLWQPASEPLQQHKLLSKLGPEPLHSSFDSDLLYQRSRGKSCTVKSFIMDSHVVVGVGNIYANEALFLAGIRPDRAAGKISRQRYEKLVENIKQVLSKAITQGGTTLKDFVGGDGKPGYFQQQLHVYGRAGLPCSQCGSTLIEKRLQQRTTVYCKQCQR